MIHDPTSLLAAKRGGRYGVISANDLRAVLSKVCELTKDPYFPKDAETNRASLELATICDNFTEIVGASIAVARAIATGKPIHDDGCSVKAHIGDDGEKHYTGGDIDEARAFYEARDPKGGAVFLIDEAHFYIKDTTAGKIGAGALSFEPCAALGYGASIIKLYRERDLWNAIRTQQPQVLTMRMINISKARGGKDGWAN